MDTLSYPLPNGVRIKVRRRFHTFHPPPTLSRRREREIDGSGSSESHMRVDRLARRVTTG
jgi:hypothetical protein